MASLEPRRTKISTGKYPAQKLSDVSLSRPFVHQLDLVFPSDPELEQVFSVLETCYHTSRGALSDIFEAAHTLPQDADVHALSTDKYVPDVWSISRGNLVLNVAKDTYELLGLQGKKLSDIFTGAAEQFVLSISITEKPHTARRLALARLDQARTESVHGLWDFGFRLSAPAQATGPLSSSLSTTHTVKPTVRKLRNIYVPVPRLSPRPRQRSEEDAQQDWDEEMSVLFEWIGMAMIGSQRLQVNDRVDPYVAIYNPPQLSVQGEVTHIQWRGLLPPAFVQEIVDCAASRRHLSTPSGDSTVPFIAITVHGTPHTPVLAPRRVPRPDGEDTLSVVFVPEESEVEGEVGGRWACIEAIGKWDARFG